ncbi:probable xyloglucan endotransglucosylase/hydrolase protein 28 [Chenopodium quinoa]|uniref:Xyloglucan endotransglucosylase/hydrolase n=1 Tax=Chenopodium quinoa TaxID=63459 RepID=A0A803LCK0_CHEQI|nr:probable xyloglucan endotransglucosylase/hydrolase protein 28 [Chenopodium quinoa]
MHQFMLNFLLICTLISYCYGCVQNFTTTSFDEGLKKLYGENIVIEDDGNTVYLSIVNNTGGSGFISQNVYESGLFSASIKLPSPNYTAGVVVAFYLSNNDKFEGHHDEIDFEFLGHANGQDWVLQTNIYGNGSTSRGREERYTLWFDPSEMAHKYSIFWGENRVIFYVDDVPIRENYKVNGLGGDYPSKPMSLIATIWDGSGWATNGGRFKINHEFDPFVARFSDLLIRGCASDPNQKPSNCDDVNVCGKITLQNLREYEEFRKQHLAYSYCHDKNRYNHPLPDCVVGPTGGRPS